MGRYTAAITDSDQVLDHALSPDKGIVVAPETIAPNKMKSSLKILHDLVSK